MEVHKYVHKTLQFSAYEIRVEIDLEREIQNVNMEPSILLFYESYAFLTHGGIKEIVISWE
jgi:hypothetical protein